jgi:hypothetical protein
MMDLHELLERKVADEGLNAQQANRLTRLIAKAEDEAKRQAILETPLSDPHFERTVRVKTRAKREEARELKTRAEHPRTARWYLDEYRRFKDALDAFQGAVLVFRGATADARASAGFGTFSPEAGRYIGAKARSIREQIDLLCADMEAIEELSQ